MESDVRDDPKSKCEEPPEWAVCRISTRVRFCKALEIAVCVGSDDKYNRIASTGVRPVTLEATWSPDNTEFQYTEYMYCWSSTICNQAFLAEFQPDLWGAV